MPQANDLMGYGMPPSLAGELGNTPVALNGAGTTQTTATLITEKAVTVTGSSSATGVIFPAMAKIGTPYYITSIGSTAAKVWPPVGHTLNGSLNTGVTFSAQYASGIFMQISSKVWVSFPLAP
jgi:hypothetical protein